MPKQSGYADGAPSLWNDIVNFARGGLTYKLKKSELLALSKKPLRNALVGGSASTNPWQRGVSFVSPASGASLADMWTWQNTTSGVVTISKSADVPSAALIGTPGSKLMTDCFLIDVTTADASIAVGDFASFETKIEGYRWRAFAQRVCAIKFWHRHTKTGTNCIAFRNSGLDRTLVLEYAQVVSDAWEEATIAFPASPSAGTWNFTTGVGLAIDFALVCGATFQTAAGAWATGNFIASANQVNNLDSTSNNFRIEDVRLVLSNGDILNLGEIESRDIGEETRLIQRYVPAWNAANGIAGDPMGVGQAISTTQAIVSLPLPVTPRAAPTGVTVTSPGSFYLRDSAGTPIAVTTIAFRVAGNRRLELTVTIGSASLVAGNATLLGANSATLGALIATGVEL
jgi:hypothetical protein